MRYSNDTLAEAVCMETLQGYYKVSGMNFFRKAEAFQVASQLRKFDITYHFLDSVYSSLDWSQEPTQSLDELYKTRAQQLRDKYDYLILSFSGGSDSYNALRAFIDNGIKLDEVVTFYPIQAIEKLLPTFDATDRSASNIMFEYVMAAKPVLKELQKLGTTKITVVDQIDKGLSLILNKKVHTNFRGGVATSLWGTGFYQVAEIARDKAGDGKNVAVIYGVDKPRMMFHGGTRKFGVFFSDFANNFGGFPDETFDGFQPKTEFFYYTPDLPAITQKQAHILKRAYINLGDKWEDKPLFSKITGNLGIFEAHSNFVKRTLYSTWRSGLWQTEKASKHFYTEGTQFFADSDLVDDSVRDVFMGQVKELVYGISPELMEFNPDGTPEKMKVLFTKPIWF